MENINKIIGARIKEVRLESGVSREYVARRMEIRQQTIEKYEKGLVEISLKRLIQISNILNVGITYLLNENTVKHFINIQVKTHLSKN